VGVVGLLQPDVLQSRLRAEYGVPPSFAAAPWSLMRWMASEDRGAIERFAAASRMDMAEDHDGEQVAFFGSDWRRKRAEEEWPMIRFLPVREQHGLAPA
jgi:peptide chain release factor 3